MDGEFSTFLCSDFFFFNEGQVYIVFIIKSEYVCI